MTARLCKNPACRRPLVRRANEGAAKFALRQSCSPKCGRLAGQAKRDAKPPLPCPGCGEPTSYWKVRAGGFCDACRKPGTATGAAHIATEDTADFSRHNLTFSEDRRPVFRHQRPATYGGVGSAWMA